MFCRFSSPELLWEAPCEMLGLCTTGCYCCVFRSVRRLACRITFETDNLDTLSINDGWISDKASTSVERVSVP